MTKLEAVTQVATRLGDTNTEFLTILKDVFNRVLEEMAQNECIGVLRKEAGYQFTAGQTNYNTGTITGLSSGPPQLYPIRVEKLVVPAWGHEGLLQKIEDEGRWDEIVGCYGATFTGRPLWWRVYPNETQVQVFPVPRSDDVTAGNLKILHWAPPTTLTDSDNIAEIRSENLHVIIAGCVWYGLPFQDETLVDRNRALIEWQSGMAAMKSQQRRARYGDITRVRYRRD